MYYTKNGKPIRNPDAYALTGAPMYTRNGTKNINEPTSIYKAELENGKVYVGKTANFDRRCYQHFSGNGSKVTKKFKPKTIKEKEVVPGYFGNEIEQEYTEKYIEKYGYENVRGGCYTNSKTLQYESESESDDEPTCYRCGRTGHFANRCYARTCID